MTQTNWDAFGASVSAASDFDGDGDFDLVIGAPVASSSQGLSGEPNPRTGRGVRVPRIGEWVYEQPDHDVEIASTVRRLDVRADIKPEQPLGVPESGGPTPRIAT